MPFIEEPWARMTPLLPTQQRGNVQVLNLPMLRALLYYMAENADQWRRLPAPFGLWNTLYQRMSRGAKTGVLNQVFEQGKAPMDEPPEKLDAGQHQPSRFAPMEPAH